MELFTERHAAKITGELSCLDRVVISSTSGVGPRYYSEIKRKEIQLQVFLGSISLFLGLKSTI